MGEKWFAWLLGRMSAHHDRLLENRKRQLLGGLTGTVAEIGPGTGANLRYYRPDIRWIGFEPNPFMHPALVREAQRLNMKLELRAAGAESMDLADASADAVVSTLVLCSAEDPAQCVKEIRRILKPGGKFIFIEHVAAGPGSALLFAQRLLKPIWSFVGGGCDPARTTARVLLGAGFSDVQIDEFRLPLGLAAPHIAGVAIR